MVTPLKTLMGFSVHLNVQLKFYNLPYQKKIDQLQKENAQLKQQLKNQTVAEKAQDSSAK